ncbi:MAG: tetratricopeptide repeat protein [Spirochaetia bacterium]|nr:tetratricopeptide repeat protein [Spirochaetia bacterium]
MKKYLLTVLLSLFISGELFAGSGKNILVLPFENRGAKEFSWISAGITDSVISDIAKIRTLNAISDEDRRKVEDELAYQRNMGKDSELIQMSLASSLLADVILSGSYTVSGDEIQIVAKLVDVRSGSTVNSVKVRGGINELFTLQDQVVIELFRRSENSKIISSTGITDEEIKEISEKPTDHLAAFEYYAKGLELKNKKPRRAFKYFKNSLEKDPDYLQALLSAGFIAGSILNLHEEALEYLNRAELILKKRKKMHTKIYADLLNNEAVIYKAKGDLKISLELYLKSKNIFDVLEYNKTTGYANLLSNIGNIYGTKKDYDRAIVYYHDAKKIFEKYNLRQTEDYAHLLNNTGIAYRQKKDLNQALEYYKQSEKIQDDLGLEKTAAYSDLMNNLGYLYERKKQPDLALSYYKRSLRIRKKLKLKKTDAYASILMNIGNIYNNRAQLKKAKKYYGQSRKIMEELNLHNTSSYGNLLYNIALLNDRQKNKDAAGKYYRKACNVYSKIYGESSKDAKDADRRAENYGY